MSTGDQTDSSVLKEWWDSVTDTYSDTLQFWKQRRLILRQPDLAVEDNAALKYKPLKFALHMTVVPALFISAVGAVLNFIPQLPPLPLEREIATVEKAKLIAVAIGKDAPPDLKAGVKPDEYQHELNAIDEFNKKKYEALKDIAEELPYELRLSLVLTPEGTLNPLETNKIEVAILEQAAKSLRIRQR